MEQNLEHLLEKNYLSQYPYEAAAVIEKSKPAEAKKIIQSISLENIIKLSHHLPTSNVAELLPALSLTEQARILQHMETPKAAEIFSRMKKSFSDKLKSSLSTPLLEAIDSALTYPSTQAGSLMDRRIFPLNEDMTVGDAISFLRKKALITLRVVFLIDKDGKLEKYINIQDLLFSHKTTPLRDIANNILTFIRDTDSDEEVFRKFDQYRLTDLPVVNYEGKFIGVIRYKTIVQAARDTAMTDMQTMVGVSKEERALSPAMVVVKKRLPWLQINLLTAFLAASVVGLFENVISAVTALAVLLPVVAGQSGNTGAQALAVTMRGIALREVFTSQWNKLLMKEFLAAFVNGLAIALTTGLFVYLWSQSIGLVLVIVISMVISMVIAAVAGTSIPLILIKIGLDPAQSSSIILTTVTDVAGFFSFLGTAAIIMNFIKI